MIDGAHVLSPGVLRYGMLGLGHAPEAVLGAMNQPHVMANIMTPAISQMRFIEALRKEIGHTRGGSPFSRFLCLNSGSEAVSVAARIADIATKDMTDPGGRYEGCAIRGLTLEGSFHGRTFGALAATDRPAFQEPFLPLMPGVRFVSVGDAVALEEAVDRSRTAAVIVEPVPANYGLLVPRREWLQHLADEPALARHDVGARAAADQADVAGADYRNFTHLFPP